MREGRGSAPDDRATVREGAATVREDRTTVREGTHPSPPSVARSGDENVAGWLPGPLAQDFRVIESLPARGGEADLYVLEPRRPLLDAGGEAGRRVAKVYRQGIAPKEDVIRRVQAANPDHVVRLEAYGRDSDRWWELMEYVERGSLRVLIEREGPRIPGSLVREILQQLNDALIGLHRLPLEHRDLKPANVLVRSRTPLDLVVTDFGISSLMDRSKHFTLAARTIRYAPPESIGTMASDEAMHRSMVMIEHTKWDYWSLGMMLVEMLQGAHPYDGLAEVVISNQLVTQNVEQLTEGIPDADWRKLCRGLLRRTPSTRWDAEAVSKWMADPGDPSLVVTEESAAAPVAAAPTATESVAFDGARFSTAADLGAALARDWRKAESFWKRRYSDVHTWVSDELGLAPLGEALAELDDSDLPLESQVFSFIYLLAPNAPVRFRDMDLTVESLAALGDRAAGQGDVTARSAMLMLYRQRILMLAAPLPGSEALAAVSRGWDEAVGDYSRSRAEFRRRGVSVPEPDDDTLVRLLAASIPGSAVLEELRVQAHGASTEDARRCDWFRALGTPETMSVAVLSMLPHLVGPASTEGRLARTRPVRGCVGGAVVGALFGRLVYWADNRQFDGGFWESVDGVVLLAAVSIALYLTIPWYREGFGGVWNALRRVGRWAAQMDSSQRIGGRGRNT